MMCKRGTSRPVWLEAGAGLWTHCTGAASSPRPGRFQRPSPKGFQPRPCKAGGPAQSKFLQGWFTGLPNNRLWPSNIRPVMSAQTPTLSFYIFSRCSALQTRASSAKRTNSSSRGCRCAERQAPPVSDFSNVARTAQAVPSGSAIIDASIPKITLVILHPVFIE